jgi:hypothetical protein
MIEYRSASSAVPMMVWAATTGLMYLSWPIVRPDECRMRQNRVIDSERSRSRQIGRVTVIFGRQQQVTGINHLL